MISPVSKTQHNIAQGVSPGYFVCNACIFTESASALGILLNMKIQELETYTQSQFEELKQLMTELSDRVSFSEQKLDDVLADSNCHLYVVIENGHIIGCATLCVFHSPTGTKASIEDVVVSSAYRGQHLGKQLMEHVLEASKTFAPIELHLTSNPKRTVANILYQSLGFERKETNCYRMMK